MNDIGDFLERKMCQIIKLKLFRLINTPIKTLIEFFNVISSKNTRVINNFMDNGNEKGYSF